MRQYNTSIHARTLGEKGTRPPGIRFGQNRNPSSSPRVPGCSFFFLSSLSLNDSILLLAPLQHGKGSFCCLPYLREHLPPFFFLDSPAPAFTVHTHTYAPRHSPAPPVTDTYRLPPQSATYTCRRHIKNYPPISPSLSRPPLHHLSLGSEKKASRTRSKTFAGLSPRITGFYSQPDSNNLHTLLYLPTRRPQHPAAVMCDYIQREFHCGHFRWIVARWCSQYLKTEMRCPLSVAHYEYR